MFHHKRTKIPENLIQLVNTCFDFPNLLLSLMDQGLLICEIGRRQLPITETERKGKCEIIKGLSEPNRRGVAEVWLTVATVAVVAGAAVADVASSRLGGYVTR